MALTFRSSSLAARRSGSARGDEIYPLADLPRHWVVLLIPGFGVASVDAYGWYDAERDTGRGSMVREAQHVPGPWPSRAAQMINDLEAPIARHHPEIDQMKTALRRAGALAAAMSGSGSTVFGLFQKRKDAVLAVERLSGSGWRVHPDRVAGPRRLRAAAAQPSDRDVSAARTSAGRMPARLLAKPQSCRKPQVSTTLRVCATAAERLQ